MGQVMGEIVQLVHHGSEQTVPVVRWDFISDFKNVHRFGSKRIEFCVDRRSLSNKKPQSIPRVHEIVLVRERQDDMARLRP